MPYADDRDMADDDPTDPDAKAAVARAAHDRDVAGTYDSLVLQLRRAGADWQTVADKAHEGVVERYDDPQIEAWPVAVCRDAYTRRVMESRVDDLSVVRAEELDRLGAILAAFWSRMRKGETDAAVICLRTIGLRIDIEGLRQGAIRVNAPVGRDVTPEQLDAMVLAVHAMAEADPEMFAVLTS